MPGSIGQTLVAALAASTAVSAAVLPSTSHQRFSRQDAAEYEGYMFAYFTGSSVEGEKIYFAASNGNDALSWQELNGGEPVLSSSKGTTGLRDPFIIRSHDGSTFYLLATDLSIGGGTGWGEAVRDGSRYLEIWESNDLVNWSEQRHVLVSPETAGMTWAPEAHWDDEIGVYAVYWASNLYAENDTEHTGTSYQRMLYATTTDFVTFSEPQVWQDAGTARIDSTVLKEDGVFYRFTKDEGAVTGCTDIIQESSNDLLDSLDGWKTVASCIGANAGTEAVEGPTSFKSNPNDVNGEKYYLFVDEYVDRGYIPLETDDIANPDWQVSASYNLPTSPRHGTVLPITAAELETLTGAYKAKRDESALTHKKKASDDASNGTVLLPGLYADPNMAVFGCQYYIYPTSDGYPGWGGKEFYVWKSSNLIDWTRSEKPFLTLNGTDGNVPWATGNAWAPTIIERDGTYYFYFSGQNPTYDQKTIGVASAPSPEGPFTAEPTAMITNEEDVTTNQAIDPDAFYDPISGKYYLYWGNGVALVAELADDMTSLVPDTTTVISGLSDFREGTFVVYREPYYHMTYSINDTGSPDYQVGYATSDNPRGPWTYRGIVLHKDVSKGILATGHDSVINVPGTDDWYMAYHRFHIPDGDGTHRETRIDRLYFDEDGLMVPVVPTLTGPAPGRIPGCGKKEDCDKGHWR
ncbi:glycoside hydrolase family 43 protein [Hortaea werneckii]|nr:glycoside hydrolase family 43 protein [Hortaea werneckii]KAI7311049.1 glycoside hydrolase family 43 protein [Hortaea werneckii]